MRGTMDNEVLPPSSVFLADPSRHGKNGKKEEFFLAN
jgi:hypothetical protein